MCGIVGTIGYKNNELLKQMNDIQIHRGPDEEGIFWNQDKLVGLGMRRLSIVDLHTGSQPMKNEDSTVIVVFNGEIFNAPELRESLRKKGHIFQTVNSDTEVLVHLYEDYGVDMLNQLNGMFAFAIYDVKKEIVFVARDQMGIKPLHYSCGEKCFAFASELKSLTETGISKKKIDNQSVWDYLAFQCVPAPNSIYEDVKVLPAAHYLIYDINKSDIEIKRYWNCYENRKSYTGSKENISPYLAMEIQRAIERWTMSDVPLACSLSGGLDSAVIAATIAKKRELHTYTLGFENFRENDERFLARKLVDQYGTKHKEIIITEEDVLSDLPKMIYAMDTPYAGGIPSWFVCKEVSGNEKVLFNGTGGDELFGNYGKWLRYEHPLARIQNAKQHRQWGEAISQLVKYPNGSIYHKYMPERVKEEILQFPVQNIRNSNSYCEQIFSECSSKSWRDKVPFIDYQIQLPEEFLMMIDRFSMNYSIEARVPFLDRELVENVMGVPGKIRTKKYEYKYLLKEIAADLLPADYIGAPKRGFVLPYSAWLSGKLKPALMELCTGEFRRKQGIFTEELEKEIILPFVQGRLELTPIVWTVFMFQMWYEHSIGV